MIFIMVYFNARVSKQQSQNESSIVGSHAIDHLNENGQRLVNFYAQNDLVIKNTFFEQKAIYKAR